MPSRSGDQRPTRRALGGGSIILRPPPDDARATKKRTTAVVVAWCRRKKRRPFFPNRRNKGCSVVEEKAANYLSELFEEYVDVRGAHEVIAAHVEQLDERAGARRPLLLVAKMFDPYAPHHLYPPRRARRPRAASGSRSSARAPPSGRKKVAHIFFHGLPTVNVTSSIGRACPKQ